MAASDMKAGMPSFYTSLPPIALSITKNTPLSSNYKRLAVSLSPKPDYLHLPAENAYYKRCIEKKRSHEVAGRLKRTM